MLPSNIDAIIKQQSQNNKNATTTEKINALVAIMEQSSVSAEQYEDMLKPLGYHPVDHNKPANLQRNVITAQAIQAAAELHVALQERPRLDARAMNNKPRYLQVFNTLYGNEEGFAQAVNGTDVQKGQFHIDKFNQALERFPQLTNDPISDQDIVRNFSTIYELYTLCYEADNAKKQIEAVENGQDAYKKMVELQDTISVLYSRAYLMTSPYYAYIDFEQMLSLDVNRDNWPKEAIPDSGEEYDHISDDRTNYLNLKDALGLSRKSSMEAQAKTSPDTTITLLDTHTNPLGKVPEPVLSSRKPVLMVSTETNGSVHVDGYIALSPLSTKVTPITPELAFEVAPDNNREVFSDLTTQLVQCDSRFKSSSDSFKQMRAAAELLNERNLSFRARSMNALTMVGTKDALEELLESANNYLQFKGQAYQRRTGKSPDETFRNAGKNAYEQSRIDIAVKLRDFARSKLELYGALIQDQSFADRAQKREENLVKQQDKKSPSNTRSNIAKLHSECAKLNPENWEVRPDGEKVAQLNHAACRDLRRLSELACLERPMDATELSEARTRMARAVTMELVRCDRLSSTNNTMGSFEAAVAADPDTVVNTIAKNRTFQKAVARLTPETLNNMLSNGGIQQIRQDIHAQSLLSPAVKTAPKAPASKDLAPNPVVKGGPGSP